MLSEIKLSPSQLENIELGLLCRELLEELFQIENDHQEAGAKRRASTVRVLGIKSLLAVYRFVRACLRVVDRHERRRSGDHYMLEVLACTSVPTPISLIYFELCEVQASRPASLLRHDSKGSGKSAFNYLRRSTKALSAAAVRALRDSGMTEFDAGTSVAGALNRSGFPNTRNKLFSWETILDWHADAILSDPDEELKDGFSDQYHEYLLLFRGMAGRLEDARRAGRSITEKEHRDLILFRLMNLTQNYRYET